MGRKHNCRECVLEMNIQCEKNMKGDHRAGVCDVLNRYQLLHTDVLNHALRNKQRNFISCSYFQESKLLSEVLLGHKQRCPLGRRHIGMSLFCDCWHRNF